VPVRALVETGFLLALNPRDENHDWALGLLEESRRGLVELHISPASPVEVSLVLRARGLSEAEVREALEAMEDAVLSYTRPRYVQLKLAHASLAADLRRRYAELSFFDSLHAAVAIAEGLAYYDLDGVVREVVRREARGAQPARSR